MNDTCEMREVTVLIQENGIIRFMPTGRFIARLDNEISYDDIKKWLADNAPSETCEWKCTDADKGYWDGACGVTWEFISDDPYYNNMTYCPCCGDKIIQPPGDE